MIADLINSTIFAPAKRRIHKNHLKQYWHVFKYRKERRDFQTTWKI